MENAGQAGCDMDLAVGMDDGASAEGSWESWSAIPLEERLKAIHQIAVVEGMSLKITADRLSELFSVSVTRNTVAGMCYRHGIKLPQRKPSASKVLPASPDGSVAGSSPARAVDATSGGNLDTAVSMAAGASKAKKAKAAIGSAGSSKKASRRDVAPGPISPDTAIASRTPDPASAASPVSSTHRAARNLADSMQAATAPNSRYAADGYPKSSPVSLLEISSGQCRTPIFESAFHARWDVSTLLMCGAPVMPGRTRCPRCHEILSASDRAGGQSEAEKKYGSRRRIWRRFFRLSGIEQKPPLILGGPLDIQPSSSSSLPESVRTSGLPDSEGMECAALSD